MEKARQFALTCELAGLSFCHAYEDSPSRKEEDKNRKQKENNNNKIFRTAPGFGPCACCCLF